EIDARRGASEHPSRVLQSTKLRQARGGQRLIPTCPATVKPASPPTTNCVSDTRTIADTKRVRIFSNNIIQRGKVKVRAVSAAACSKTKEVERRGPHEVRSAFKPRTVLSRLRGWQ